MNSGKLTSCEADRIINDAPWPALLLTADGRILRWNGHAARVLDPSGAGLDGLRLSFALEDQGSAGAPEVRIALDVVKEFPDAAAEIVMLDLRRGDFAAGPGFDRDLASALRDGVADVGDMISANPDLTAASAIARAMTAILAAVAAAPSPPAASPEQCATAAAAAALLKSLRPRFEAEGRTLQVALESDAPEVAAISSSAFSDIISALLDLVVKDPSFGDAAIRLRRSSEGDGLAIDLSVKAGAGSKPGALAPQASELFRAFAALHFRPIGGDATLVAPGADEALHLQLTTPTAEQPQPPAPKPRPGLPDLSGVSILMAEDNLTNQLVASEMLNSMGVSLDVASDGAEALEMLEQKLYDLLLVDIEMPRVSGLEVINRVRRAGNTQSGRPIVALTAYAMQEHRTRIMEAGADGLIPKPILSIAELGLTLLDHLGRNAPETSDALEMSSAAVTPEPPHEVSSSGIDEVVEDEIFDALTTAIGPEASEELMEKVNIDLSSVRDEISLGAENGDMEAVRHASHILISVAGAIGAVRLQGMAERLNRLAHDDDKVAMRDLSLEALTELRLLLLFIEQKAGVIHA